MSENELIQVLVDSLNDVLRMNDIGHHAAHIESALAAAAEKGYLPTQAENVALDKQ